MPWRSTRQRLRPSSPVPRQECSRARRWRHLDPANTGLPTTDVTTIAMDPKAPQTLYVGTDSNGVFKSTDGGSTWNPAGTGLPDSSISFLVMDPASHDALRRDGE